MANASASARSGHLALSMLNKASAKTGGTWEVVVWHPYEDNYEYKFQGKSRQGTNFFCDLVSPDDTRSYLRAQFKKKLYERNEVSASPPDIRTRRTLRDVEC